MVRVPRRWPWRAQRRLGEGLRAPVHYRRRASLTAFVNNTGAGRATREGALTGSRAYGLMLLPGMFQPSHPSTVSSAGCLAMYPPVSI